MDQLILLTRMHLPEIEEQIHGMVPEVLLNDEVELPEEHADQILKMVDLWRDRLPELLSGIMPNNAMAFNIVQRAFICDFIISIVLVANN